MEQFASFGARRRGVKREPCSSGSHVDQAAIRLARPATGRTGVIKFGGAYHGWFDSTLWSTAPSLEASGPRDAPVAVQGSHGQLAATADALVVLPWNDRRTTAMFEVPAAHQPS